MPLDDRRAFWERHLGIVHGPPNRPAWRRLGLATVAALLVITVIVLVGALLVST